MPERLRGVDPRSVPSPSTAEDTGTVNRGAAHQLGSPDPEAPVSPLTLPTGATYVPIPNWFSMYADRYFEKGLAEFKGNPRLEFCQVGVWQGDATRWMLDHILTHPTSRLIDVDTWMGSAEHARMPFTMRDVEAEYDRRFQDEIRVHKSKQTSRTFFRVGLGQFTRFDFIYIDGDHDAPEVLKDGIDAFERLKIGGIMAFDDYLWQDSGWTDRQRDPGVGIDAFLTCFGHRLTILAAPPQSQVWVRRIS